MAKLQAHSDQCAYSSVFCRCDTVWLLLPDGHYTLLSRMKSFEGGEETAYCCLREAYSKLVQPVSWVSWQSFLGYVNKGCKRGEYLPCSICLCKGMGRSSKRQEAHTMLTTLTLGLPGAEAKGWGGQHRASRHKMCSRLMIWACHG